MTGAPIGELAHDLLLAGTTLDGVLAATAVPSLISGTLKPGLTGYLGVKVNGVEETAGARVPVTGAFSVPMTPQAYGSSYKAFLARSATSIEEVHATGQHQVLQQGVAAQTGGAWCGPISGGLVTVGAPLSCLGMMLAGASAYLVLFNLTDLTGTAVNAEVGARSAAVSGIYSGITLTPTQTGIYVIRGMSAASGGTVLFQTAQFVVQNPGTVTFVTPPGGTRQGTAFIIKGGSSDVRDFYVSLYNVTTSTEEARTVIGSGSSWTQAITPLGSGTYQLQAHYLQTGGTLAGQSGNFSITAPATGTITGSCTQQGVPATFTGTISNGNIPSVQLFLGGSGENVQVPVTMTSATAWTAQLSAHLASTYTAKLFSDSSTVVAQTGSFTTSANSSEWGDLDVKQPAVQQIVNSTVYFSYGSGNISGGQFWIGLTPSGSGVEESPRAGPFSTSLTSAYASAKTVDPAYVGKMWDAATGGNLLATTGAFSTVANQAPGPAAGSLSLWDVYPNPSTVILGMQPVTGGGIPTAYTVYMRASGATSWGSSIGTMTNTNTIADGGVSSGSLSAGGTPMVFLVPPSLVTPGKSYDFEVIVSNAVGASASAATLLNVLVPIAGQPHVPVATQGQAASYGIVLSGCAQGWAALCKNGVQQGTRVVIDASMASVSLTANFNGMGSVKLFDSKTGGIQLHESDPIAFVQANPSVALTGGPTVHGQAATVGYTPTGITAFWVNLYGPNGDETRVAVSGATSGTAGTVTVPASAGTGIYMVHAYDAASGGNLLGTTSAVLI